ncbi:IS3 family transposase, partial [Listeria monocytogenes]|nr:IS3 family transposase [Listeria monocytogenes]
KFNLKKSDCHIHATLQQRLKAISLLQHEHTIVRLCRALQVNRSTYYKFIQRQPSKRKQENQQLKKWILEIYSQAKKRFGAAKIQVVLKRDYGVSISLGRVYRLLRQLQLPKMSTVKPSYQKRKVDEAPHDSCPNHLKQAFNPPAPNQVWTTDFSYIPVGKKGFVYLCIVMNLFSRKIIAWQVAHKINTDLALQTLEVAYKQRRPSQTVMIHSDRGSQYTAKAYRRWLDEHDLLASYSKKAYPWDNAVTEAFFKYMKKEELDRRAFSSIQDVQLACFEYIESFYNRHRPHSTINMLTPEEKENFLFQQSVNDSFLCLLY